MWVYGSASLHISSGTLSNLLNLSEPQCIVCKNGDSKRNLAHSIVVKVKSVNMYQVLRSTPGMWQALTKYLPSLLFLFLGSTAQPVSSVPLFRD